VDENGCRLVADTEVEWTIKSVRRANIGNRVRVFSLSAPSIDSHTYDIDAKQQRPFLGCHKPMVRKEDMLSLNRDRLASKHFAIGPNGRIIGVTLTHLCLAGCGAAPSNPTCRTKFSDLFAVVRLENGLRPGLTGFLQPCSYWIPHARAGNR
jgi:hypothetical protein